MDHCQATGIGIIFTWKYPVWNAIVMNIGKTAQNSVTLPLKLWQLTCYFRKGRTLKSSQLREP